MALAMQVTFDAADPAALAGFWKQVLGYIEEPPPEGWSSWEDWAREEGSPRSAGTIRARSSTRTESERGSSSSGSRRARPRRTACTSTCARRPGLDPDARRARLMEESERLIELGATKLYELEERGAFWITMQDPEGNEFCLD